MILNENLDNRQLLNDILERNYYVDFRSNMPMREIEVFLLGTCKSNCDYCYLKKNQKALFPNELVDFDLIIKNFEIFLNWYIENKFRCEIDIFSGEWLTTDLCEPIFDLMYEKFSQVHPQLRPKIISMADNAQFINNDVLTNKIQNYINKFKNDLNIDIFMSISVDGKYCDYGRKENLDEFYTKLFKFMETNNYYAHPMISSDNIKYWIQNYKWWLETAPKYIVDELMTLEVRDKTWTHESIAELINYCDFLIDYKFEHIYNKDLNKFFMYVFQLNQPCTNYSAIQLLETNMFEGRDNIHCHFSRMDLCIRISDLSLGLCHRQFYPELMIGKFHLEDDKIIDMDEINVALLIMKDNLKRSCLPHCETCQFVGICTGFCAGESYEHYGNSLVPSKQVCEMYIAKNSFLLYKYYKMGLLEWLNSSPLNERIKKYLISLTNTVVGELKEIYG